MPADLLPSVSYRPPAPADPPTIGLVGCGNITTNHLDAYTGAGWDVAAFCDIDAEAARTRRDEYYPEADVTTDATEVFTRSDIGVVDIATHPGPRADLVEEAIRAGKHVLSQKPFVIDLDIGERLVSLAADHGVKLAVNQNGRWAPHWSWIRNAVADGYVGEVLSVHFDRHWDHDPIVTGRFDDIRHAILYDYAIHYFDMLACVVPDRRPLRVSATVARTAVQESAPPLLGQAIVDYEGAQASLTFDGNVRNGTVDRTFVGGTAGTLRSEGPGHGDQRVTLHAEDGAFTPSLDGEWAPHGFRGTMGELLCAIEEGREPENAARDNLRSLELCYAAIASAEDGESKVPGEVRELRQGDPADLVPA